MQSVSTIKYRVITQISNVISENFYLLLIVVTTDAELVITVGIASAIISPISLLLQAHARSTLPKNTISKQERINAFIPPFFVKICLFVALLIINALTPNLPKTLFLALQAIILLKILNFVFFYLFQLPDFNLRVSRVVPLALTSGMTTLATIPLVGIYDMNIIDSVYISTAIRFALLLIFSVSLFKASRFRIKQLDSVYLRSWFGFGVIALSSALVSPASILVASEILDSITLSLYIKFQTFIGFSSILANTMAPLLIFKVTGDSSYIEVLSKIRAGTRYFFIVSGIISVLYYFAVFTDPKYAYERYVIPIIVLLIISRCAHQLNLQITRARSAGIELISTFINFLYAAVCVCLIAATLYFIPHKGGVILSLHWLYLYFFACSSFGRPS